jgi:hypothetical protein
MIELCARSMSSAAPLCLFWSLCLLTPADLALAEPASRPAQAILIENEARQMFSNGDYDKAVPLLERGSAVFTEDLPLMTLLSMAYLYSSSRLDSVANLPKAKPLMEKVIDRGGAAVFVAGLAVNRSKEKVTGHSVMGGSHVTDVVMGELRILKDSVRFVPSRGSSKEVGPLSSQEIQECGINKKLGKDSNTFHLKTGKTEYNFRPLHFSSEEANLACTLISKYLNAKFSR